jgi:hypothetical protein
MAIWLELSAPAKPVWRFLVPKKGGEPLTSGQETAQQLLLMPLAMISHRFYRILQTPPRFPAN